jgi:hypothetical protein
VALRHFALMFRPTSLEKLKTFWYSKARCAESEIKSSRLGCLAATRMDLRSLALEVAGELHELSLRVLVKDAQHCSSYDVLLFLHPICFKLCELLSRIFPLRA